MTNEERMEAVVALDRAHWHVYEIDFTAFESLHPSVMNVIEGQLYDWAWGPTRARLYMKGLTGRNIMTNRNAGLRATCDGRRMSGEMTTSLGNGFTNLVVLKYVIASKGGHFQGLVEGDDSVFVSDVEITAADFLPLGFQAKVECRESATLANFCGLTFGDDRQIIKDPRKVFAGFAWSDNCMSCN